ncbi:MAG: valine--tRNA ligase [Sphingobacteriales bacterium]|nr:valine--tRNA ligase [Sphingobacteriales bacterium]
MEISKHYNPGQIEEKWYRYWLEHKLFKSEPDEREPYTIVIPPPNVTGVLHMGHMLNNTIQDVLVRRARMLGKNACWLPGTDHASIATESKVVAMLRERGISKSDISREDFLKYAWEWKEKHGGIILEQLKKLGCSCDWDRTAFTMDDNLSRSVIRVFIHLYRKGLIYRGIRMINWDPQAKTAVSDEEVNYKEVNSRLYYVRYRIAGTEEYLTVATTRPETILGDTAVCVNPADERYKHLKNSHVIVPMVNRTVPVIFDDYVDMEFGTGALKITPAHDINDYQIGLKYHLPVIDIFNDDGTISPAGELFIGIDRFEARKLAEEKLKEENALVKIENYTNKVGFSERTDAVIEPRISTQWFMKMRELALPAIENVMNNNIRFHPSKFKNIYRHWMENVTDWCISRQLWWGHRIPAWYAPDGSFEVAENQEEAWQLMKQKNPAISFGPNDLKQDEDVLDTWFSSWLWPISTFNGILEPDNKDINYYYPTDDLVTAPDIIFFWVARMIMAGYEFRGEKPFKNVYFTGTVRDKLRRKMSKSLGNSPEPLELIEKYGADGVRVGMLLSSPAGNDLLFDESLCEQGRNFNNKIWNAYRLIKSWQSDTGIQQSESNKLIVKWFDTLLNREINSINEHFSKYRISDALMSLYKLTWDDFCSWYLELIKPQSSRSIDPLTYQATVTFLDKILRLLHPFIPFITEELWHGIHTENNEKSIMYSEWPKASDSDLQLIQQFEQLKQLITDIRDFKKTKNIPQTTSIELAVAGKDSLGELMNSIVVKMCKLGSISILEESNHVYPSFFSGKAEYFVLSQLNVDYENEKEQIMKELEYYQGFLKNVEAKLNNTKFIEKAPEQVVTLEKKKQQDALEKINMLKEKLKKIK